MLRRKKKIFLGHSVHSGSGFHLHKDSMCTDGISLGVKLPERESDYLLQCSKEVAGSVIKCRKNFVMSNLHL